MMSELHDRAPTHSMAEVGPGGVVTLCRGEEGTCLGMGTADWGCALPVPRSTRLRVAPTACTPSRRFISLLRLPLLARRGASWRARLGGPWSRCSAALSRARWPPAASRRCGCLHGSGTALGVHHMHQRRSLGPRAAGQQDCLQVEQPAPAPLVARRAHSCTPSLLPRPPAGAPRHHAGGRPPAGGGCQGAPPGRDHPHLAGGWVHLPAHCMARWAAGAAWAAAAGWAPGCGAAWCVCGEGAGAWGEAGVYGVQRVASAFGAERQSRCCPAASISPGLPAAAPAGRADGAREDPAGAPPPLPPLGLGMGVKSAGGCGRQACPQSLCACVRGPLLPTAG